MLVFIRHLSKWMDRWVRDPNEYYQIIRVVLFVFPAINPLETSSEEYDTSCNISFRIKEKSY